MRKRCEWLHTVYWLSTFKIFGIWEWVEWVIPLREQTITKNINITSRKCISALRHLPIPNRIVKDTVFRIFWNVTNFGEWTPAYRVVCSWHISITLYLRNIRLKWRAIEFNLLLLGTSRSILDFKKKSKIRKFTSPPAHDKSNVHSSFKWLTHSIQLGVYIVFSWRDANPA